MLLYLGLCLLPLGVAVVGPLPPGRGFWVEFGVALGFVGVGMMAVQFVLTARYPAFSRSLGQDTLLQFHRVAGIGAAVCVLAHPVVLISADRSFAEFFDPRVNLPRAVALSSVTVAIVALILLSVWRSRFGLKYEWWRVSHGLLAAFAMVVAAAHVVMVDHYSEPLMKKAALVAIIGAPLAMLGHIRLVRPLMMRRRPWRVDSVRAERDAVWTVTLRPEGHDGMGFKAGQFVWLIFDKSPFDPRENPFTIASSAEKPGELRFTIKELGDFTGTVGRIEPGTTVYVQGPAGGFTVADGVPEVVLIAGGIGITPGMSIIRTALDRGEKRPIRLLYATSTLERATFREELAAADASDAVTVTHVPENPPEGWEGETGYIDRAMLGRLLTRATLGRAHFMICGPAPMMDAVEDALLELGVDRGRIRSERFDII
ncbi:MAG: ferredoxin reductase family protein [Planctomycetes bacterium]|nr:ferredoxin reductase family protein [Planctomycetota bacterium]